MKQDVSVFMLDVPYVVSDEMKSAAHACVRQFLNLKEIATSISLSTLLGRLLMAKAMKTHSPTWNFKKTSEGSYGLFDEKNNLLSYASLSHCDELVTLAISSSPLGVDVDKIENTFTNDLNAQRHFSDWEQADWEKLPDALKPLRFQQLWCLKEAFVKALGQDQMENMTRGCFLIADDNLNVRFHYDDRDLNHKPVDENAWQFKLGYPTPDHVVALAVQTPQKMKLESQRWSLENFLQVLNSFTNNEESLWIA